MLKAFVTAISFMLLYCLVSSKDTLEPGEALNPSSFLFSAQGIFTLGFYTLQNRNFSYLAIWYTDDSLHPVWIGNRNMPVKQDAAILNVTSTGKLLITDSNEAGVNPIVLFEAETSTNVTATLLDSGNFVVQEMWPNGSTPGIILWQSFDYPTDVLLPGMKLGVNHRTGRNWTLTSWISENNPASGAFTLQWDPMKRRLFLRRGRIVRWTSGDLKLYNEDNNLKFHTFDNIKSKPNPDNFSYNLINVSNHNEEYFTLSPFQVPFSKRRTMSGWRLGYKGNIGSFGDYDGSVVEVDKCYGDARMGAPKGCELWETPTCRSSSSIDLVSGKFKFTVNYSHSTNLGYSDCRETCWNDCNCIGFKDDENGCITWKGKIEDFVHEDSSNKIYIISAYTEMHSKKGVFWLWIVIPVAAAVFLLAILVSFYLLIRKLRQVKSMKREEDQELEELMKMDGYTEESEFENGGGTGSRAADLKRYTYASILALTNCFSLDNKLGEGGFGPVYKGKTPNGQEIAVKLLSRRSEQGFLEFKTELVLISKLQHRNLVKLSGFCIHRDDKMIIYDYMPNGSLDTHLFDSEKRQSLNWEKRFHIIEGIAQGLLYLHKYSRIMIVHRDLKASNILLDSDMNPKISDFGMARIFNKNAIEMNTHMCAGTYGYMAPEYAMQGVFSVKSDVYSFGVLMLEIVSGRRINSFHHLEGPLSLVELAWELWKESAELEVMDSSLKDYVSRMKDQVKRCIQISLLCVEYDAVNRPLIEEVILMLKNEAMVLLRPKKPAFILRNDDGVQNFRESKPKRYSKNSLSVSMMHGR